MCGSTCFGHLPAHHQEHTTALGSSGFTVAEKRLVQFWWWGGLPQPTTLQPFLSNGKTRGPSYDVAWTCECQFKFHICWWSTTDVGWMNRGSFPWWASGPSLSHIQNDAAINHPTSCQMRTKRHFSFRLKKLQCWLPFNSTHCSRICKMLPPCPYTPSHVVLKCKGNFTSNL
jgi:hypothetical protein